MIYITFMSHGVNNTEVTRVVKSDSLDYTSVPSAELINGRMLNLYECPENIPVKVWKKSTKQSRLEMVWKSLPRKRRIHIVVSMMADSYGAEKFEWYEI
jgi:alkyl hydroperoxide reductase subunit AhpC